MCFEATPLAYTPVTVFSLRVLVPRLTWSVLALVCCVKCEFLLTSGRCSSFRKICSVVVFNDGQVSFWSDLSTRELVEVLAFSLQMPVVANPRLAIKIVIASI